MSDQKLNYFLMSGTDAEMTAHIPDPPTAATGPDYLQLWFNTTDSGLYRWDGLAYELMTTVFASAAEFRTGTEAGKALSPDAVFDAAAFVALTDGATVTPDFSTGFNFTWLIAGDRTLANPTNAKEGQMGCIRVTQDTGGSHTIAAFGANYRFAGGTDIVLSTVAGDVDLLFYVVLPGGLIFLSAQLGIAA